MKKRKLRKKYKKRIFIVVILLLIIGIVLYFLFFKKDKYTKSISIEAGEEVPEASDYLKGSQEKITWSKNLKIKDNKVYQVGNYKGTIKSGLIKYTVKLVVGDTTVPIISGYKDLSVSVNSNIDLLENIVVTDNSKEDIKATVEGDYDLTKIGKYDLEYKACDSSKNCSTESFKLTVKNGNTKEVTIVDNNDVTMKYVDGVLIVNKSFPLPANYVPENLVSAGGRATAIDYVVDAFNELKEDASAEGLNIYASTAYRSYEFQKTLYTNYVSRDGKEEADTYSARPGYSEHQTGLAIDCNTVNESFTDTDEGKWLNDNAWKYGFTIRFPKGKQNETGYMYESWHIRYVGKELAKTLYNNGDWLSLEGYFNLPSEYAD